MREKVTAAKRAMTSRLGGKIDGVLEKDHEVRMRDGTTIICRTYELEARGSGTPGMYVVFHGGAWCIGGLENEEMLCRLVARTYGMVCVNVDYRLAPENKFPTGFYDCLDATQWVQPPPIRTPKERRSLTSVTRPLQMHPNSALTRVKVSSWAARRREEISPLA